MSLCPVTISVSANVGHSALNAIPSLAWKVLSRAIPRVKETTAALAAKYETESALMEGRRPGKTQGRHAFVHERLSE